MVIEGVLFGVGAAVAWGTADYTTSIIAKGGRNFPALLAAHTAGSTFMAVLFVLVVDPPALSSWQWVACLALGPFSVVTYLTLFRALDLGPLALVSPVVAGWAVVTVFLALVVLAEPLNATQILGCSSIVIGVLLAAARLGKLEEGELRTGPGVMVAIGAMVALGLYHFALGNLAQSIGWFMPLFVSRSVGVVVMVGLATRSGEWPWRRLEPRALAAALIVAGLGATAGAMSFSRGAEVSSIAITSAAAAIYPVIPVAAGILLLKERIAASQAVGLVMIVAGLLILAVAG
jgi:drug/metabolite transporter (DMT)-like permease